MMYWKHATQTLYKVRVLLVCLPANYATVTLLRKAVRATQGDFRDKERYT